MVFFGTPHGGLRTYDLEEMVDADSSAYEESRLNLLRQLREGSEFLESQKELTSIWEKYKPNVLSFYETGRTRAVSKVGF